MNLVPEVIVMSVVGCLCMSVVLSLLHLRSFLFSFRFEGIVRLYAQRIRKKGEDEMGKISLQWG